MSTEVYLVVYRFFEFDGSKESIGGQQRYTRHLINLLESLGAECYVLQKGTADFERSFSQRTRIYGISAPLRAYGDTLFNLKVHARLPGNAKVIYISSQLAFPNIVKRSIGIQHGIWWDGRFNFLEHRLTQYIIHSVCKDIGALICVDTNFINWYRATWPRDTFVNDKFEYIPNCVDGRVFPKEAVSGPSRSKIRILIPRRFEENRGILLMIEVVKKITAEFPGLEFHFVGEGSLENRLKTELSEEIQQGYVQVYAVLMEQMGPVYFDSDIVVIPTLYGEGTSLSCVEALYLGKPVIATQVGGLPNLIVDRVNGLLVAPTPTGLYIALKQMIQEPALRERLSQNARLGRENYTFQNWAEKVSPIIERIFGPIRP